MDEELSIRKSVRLRKANPVKGMRMVAWYSSVFAVWEGASHRPAGGEEIGGADRHVSTRPARGGGADSASPLPYFLDSSKTAAYLDSKLSVPSPASTWRLPLKRQKSPFGNFWENDVLVTPCFAILGKKKTANVWRLPEFWFWSKMQSKRQTA